MHNKLFGALCLCFAISLNVIAMQQVEDDIKAIQAQTYKGNVNELKQQVSELSQNKANYRKIMLLVHSDKTGANKDLEEIAKVANEAYGEKNREKVIPAEQPTIYDFERVKILKKKDEIDIANGMLKNYSICLTTLMQIFPVEQIELLRSFIGNVMGTFFALLSDRFIMVQFPEDSPIRKKVDQGHKNLDILKLNHGVEEINLRIQKEKKNQLETESGNLDSVIRRKLEKHFNKGNK